MNECQHWDFAYAGLAVSGLHECNRDTHTFARSKNTQKLTKAPPLPFVVRQPSIPKLPILRRRDPRRRSASREAYCSIDRHPESIEVGSYDSPDTGGSQT